MHGDAAICNFLPDGTLNPHLHKISTGKRKGSSSYLGVSMKKDKKNPGKLTLWEGRAWTTWWHRLAVDMGQACMAAPFLELRVGARL